MQFNLELPSDIVESIGENAESIEDLLTKLTTDVNEIKTDLMLMQKGVSGFGLSQFESMIVIKTIFFCSGDFK